MAAAIEIVDVYKKLGSRQVLDGVSLSVETGQIPHYRLGKLIRFHRREVLAWFAAQRSETP